MDKHVLVRLPLQGLDPGVDTLGRLVPEKHGQTENGYYFPKFGIIKLFISLL